MKAIKLLLLLLSSIIVSACNNSSLSSNGTNSTNINNDAAEFDTVSVKQYSADNVNKLYCDDIDFDNFDLNNITPEIKLCLEESPVGYHYALKLREKGEITKSKEHLSKFLANNPDHKMAFDLLKSYDAPLAVITEQAHKKLLKWLRSPSQIPEFSLKEPARPKLPKPVVLVKSEFETSDNFNIRVKNAQEERLAEIELLEDIYQKEVEEYNNAVDDYNLALNSEIEKRKEQSEAMLWRFIKEEVDKTLGIPVIRDAHYDADDEIFYAKLSSTRSNYDKWIIIKVPLEEAKDFSKDLNQVKPFLQFELDNNNSLIVTNVAVSYKGVRYASEFALEAYKPNLRRKVVRVGELKPAKIKSIQTK